MEPFDGSEATLNQPDIQVMSPYLLCGNSLSDNYIMSENRSQTPSPDTR